MNSNFKIQFPSGGHVHVVQIQPLASGLSARQVGSSVPVPFQHPSPTIWPRCSGLPSCGARDTEPPSSRAWDMTVPPPNLGLELQHRPRGLDTHAADWPLTPTRIQNSLAIEPVVSAYDHSQPPTHQDEAPINLASRTANGRSTPPDQGAPHWPSQTPDQERFLRQMPPDARPDTPSIAPKPSHTHHVLRCWLLEIFTVIVAVLLLCAIVALSSYYDGRYMPEWPFQINLNSAIAFLATFLKAAIVAAVAEIIGQIKWTWFTERTRPLHHLQDFDAASRSTLGSLRLTAVVLWNWGFTSAGLLGLSAALVTIASLAVGPVTQQAITTAACPQLLVDERAAIPGAHYVPGTSAYYRTGAGSFEVEVDMKSALIKGLTERADGSAGVDVDCRTGNCTWPDYGTGVTHATIGLCSKCLDTTDFVSAPNEGGNLTMPSESEANLNYMSGQYMWVGSSNLSAYTALFDEDFALAASVSLGNISVLAASKSPCTPGSESNKLSCPHRVSQSDNVFFEGLGDYVATSCVLYPCMKEYFARYEDNKLAEKLVKTTVAIPNAAETIDSRSAFSNYTATQSPCVLENGTWYDYHNQSDAPQLPGRTWANISLGDDLRGLRNISVPNACLYKMDGIFHSAVAGFLADLFAGRCSYSTAQTGNIDCGAAWWLTPLWGQMDATPASLAGAMAAFATAATDKFRATGLGPDAHRGDPPSAGAAGAGAGAYGAVYATSTCMYFSPRWIALPAVLVGACAVLLACVCVKNCRDPEQPVWKGSVLPLMFFGLHGPGAGAGTATATATTTAMAPPPAQHQQQQQQPGQRRDGPPEKQDADSRAAAFARAAPELERIHGVAGKMWVRFHGGTEPGFVDLGAMHSENDGQADGQASVVELVTEHGK